MPEYRFYKIRTDGHIAGPPPLVDLPDDSAAILEAKKVVEDLDIEIWQGSRLVARIVAEQT